MIKVLNDMGDDIIGFELSGVVTGDDYEQILIPAIKEKLTTNEKLKVLYHVGNDFDSYEFKAMLDDAMAGMEFFGNWEKIAVVSDVEWIINAVKIFAFMVPSKVRTFTNKQIEEAKAWLKEEKVLTPKLQILLDEKTKIAILEPKEELSKDDFIYANSLIDPFISKVGKLNGIIIYTKDFPGWSSFSAFLEHMEFIKDHHKQIKKLAFVTDSFVGEMAERVGSHFVSAEVKDFDFTALNEAKNWILEDN